MLQSDTQRVIDALSAQGALNGCKRVTRDWPKSVEQLPCVVVWESINDHAAYWNDTPYVERLEYDVRVFAVKAAEIDSIAPQVDLIMEKLGYTRVMSHDQNEFETKQKVIKYRRFTGSK